MNDSCSDLSQALILYAEGELTGEEVLHLQRHLRSCRGCRRKLTRHDALTHALLAGSLEDASDSADATDATANCEHLLPWEIDRRAEKVWNAVHSLPLTEWERETATRETALDETRETDSLYLVVEREAARRQTEARTGAGRRVGFHAKAYVGWAAAVLAIVLPGLMAAFSLLREAPPPHVGETTLAAGAEEIRSLHLAAEGSRRPQLPALDHRSAADQIGMGGQLYFVSDADRGPDPVRPRFGDPGGAKHGVLVVSGERLQSRGMLRRRFEMLARAFLVEASDPRIEAVSAAGMIYLVPAESTRGSDRDTVKPGTWFRLASVAATGGPGRVAAGTVSSRSLHAAGRARVLYRIEEVFVHQHHRGIDIPVFPRDARTLCGSDPALGFLEAMLRESHAPFAHSRGYLAEPRRDPSLRWSAHPGPNRISQAERVY